MKIVVAVKVLNDDKDIVVLPDRSLDYSMAHQVVSSYDLNAIEAAAQLMETCDNASLVAISASSAKADDPKVKKSILSRGPEELFLVADDALTTADSFSTAQVLKKILDEQVKDFDLIICGDGSADMYAGQVDVQLATALGIPVINAVTSLKAENGKIIAERTLDSEIEVVEIEMPAIVSVDPEIALPRIAGMREILAAGKKPATVNNAAALGAEIDQKLTIEAIQAPEAAPRKNEIYDMSNDGDLDAFTTAVAKLLR